MSVAKFNAIDGVDGAGKSLQLKLIDELMKMMGLKHTYIRTREPGGTPLAEEIRGTLLRKRPEGEEQMCPITENCLFWGARAQHVEKLIKPKLAEGISVFTDRFYDVTYAYQGAGRGIAAAVIDKYRELTIGEFKPDNIAIFDADLCVLSARVTAREEQNRLDGEDPEFYAKARDIFLSRARHDPERYSIIDAGFHPVHVFGQMISWLGRCGMFNLNDRNTFERVQNVALNVYWELWNHYMEPIKHHVEAYKRRHEGAQETSAMPEDDQSVGYRRLIEQYVPSYMLTCVSEETGLPIYDFVGSRPMLLAGMTHFNSHRDPSQERLALEIYFNNEAAE